MKELERAHARHGRRPCRRRIVIHEHGKGNALVRHEATGVARVSGADHHHLGTRLANLVIAVAQLRDVLAAEQSPEMAQEDQNDLSLGPQIAESVEFALRIGERERGEFVQHRALLQPPATADAVQTPETRQAREA